MVHFCNVSHLFDDLKQKKILKLKWVKYIMENTAENTYIFFKSGFQWNISSLDIDETGHLEETLWNLTFEGLCIS